MVSITRDQRVAVSAEKAWLALRDVGNAHCLFAPVLTSSTLDGDVRTVTFADGMVVREKIIDIDDNSCRVTYAVLDDLFKQHSASMQILPVDENCCRFVWISDFLPDENAEMVRPLVDLGANALAFNLEQADG